MANWITIPPCLQIRGSRLFQSHASPTRSRAGIATYRAEERRVLAMEEQLMPGTIPAIRA